MHWAHSVGVQLLCISVLGVCLCLISGMAPSHLKPKNSIDLSHLRCQWQSWLLSALEALRTRKGDAHRDVHEIKACPPTLSTKQCKLVPTPFQAPSQFIWRPYSCLRVTLIGLCLGTCLQGPSNTSYYALFCHSLCLCHSPRRFVPHKIHLSWSLQESSCFGVLFGLLLLLWFFLQCWGSNLGPHTLGKWSTTRFHLHPSIPGLAFLRPGTYARFATWYGKELGNSRVLSLPDPS